MIRQFELVERVRAYNPDADEDLLNRAYFFAMRAHGGQSRANGEPFFNHPVEVAAILTSLRLDDATIATALLHDTVEDTSASLEEIEKRFGVEIAGMVDGVSKLSKITRESRARAQAANLHKLLVAMAKDPRVLLVKLADRLHNMRTIRHLRPEKRERIARETMEIFAPLAARMGMQAAREELEDLAFKVINPEARLSIMKRFAHLKLRAGDDVVARISAMLRDQLKGDGIAVEVYGREKRPYSIWRKMQQKRVTFEQLSDIIGFRAIVDEELDCYRALGSIHRGFSAVQERFKDYVSNPKTNGYRSLHTTVVGPGGARIEVQIRTHAMDEVAERGVAAHWAYRQGVRGANPFAVDPFKWLRELVERVDRLAADAVNDEDHEAFLEDAKMEMAFDQIYCFTPRGEVKGLPLGATALDFAYAIHTDVGHTAVGAKINGERAMLSTPLRNGQTVEIIQSAGQRPTPIWYDMVKTGRARAAIRRELKARERIDAARLGETLVRRAFEREDAAYSDKSLAAAARRLNASDPQALLADVSAGRVSAVQVLDAVYPNLAGERARGGARGAVGSGDPNRAYAVVARSAAVSRSSRPDACADPSASPPPEMPVAPCCRPLPGERIVGVREPRAGFRIHSIDCPALAAYEDALERWIDVDWGPDAGASADNLARIEVTIANEPGSLGAVCALIGRFGANIDDMAFQDRKPDFFRLKIDVEVRDVRHLANVLTALNAQPMVTEARRRREIDALRPAAEDDALTHDGRNAGALDQGATP